MPQSVVFSNAFVMAFSRDMIEVATLINGKLVKVPHYFLLCLERLNACPSTTFVCSTCAQTFSFVGLRCFTQQGGVFFGSQLPSGTTSLYCFSSERLAGDADGTISCCVVF